MTLEQTITLDQQSYVNTFGSRIPVAFERGEGMLLYGTDGKPYVDFFGGIAVTALGHSHPAVVEALCAQARRFLHCSNLYYIPQQARLAQLLVDNTMFDRAFIANSGAEANEGAIKFARKYAFAQRSGRFAVISANNSFHGRTLATVAATGQPKYQAPYAPLPSGFHNVAFGSVSAIESAITPETCAVLLEMIQGEGGVIEAPPAYFQAVQALCREHDLLLIVDEVQTGMGRTGTLLCCEQFGITPDIVTLAKALGNGMPIGAVLCTQRVADAVQPGDHGSTFGGNPLACAAGIAVMETLLQTDVLENCRAVGGYMKAQLTTLAQTHACVRAVRGRGLLLGMELAPEADVKPLVLAALARGFLIGSAGHNTLRFAPPLIVTQQHVDELIALLGAILPT